MTDDDFNVRMAMKMTPDGGMSILTADGKGGFAEFDKIPSDDALTTNPLGFSKDGKTLYVMDQPRAQHERAEDDRSRDQAEQAHRRGRQVGCRAVMIHPTEKRIEAVSFNYERRAGR
jgi:sugar lactone lactonase YvrE